MTNTHPNPDQTTDEDLAATLRDTGTPWPEIADTLAITVAAAKKYAAAADQRATDRAARDQISLF